jgi:hypothetical protein
LGSEGASCVICPNGCKKPGEIRVETDDIIFYICESEDCHKKLVNYMEGCGYLRKDVRSIVLEVGDDKLELPNDKRVLNGVASKIREALNGQKNSVE